MTALRVNEGSFDRFLAEGGLIENGCGYVGFARRRNIIGEKNIESTITDARTSIWRINELLLFRQISPEAAGKLIDTQTVLESARVLLRSLRSRP
jgi:hypothetical protein